MGKHIGGEFKCPIEGCTASFKSPEALRNHLKLRHGLSARETWPLITPLKRPGGDWDKFKADFEALEAGRL